MSSMQPASQAIENTVKRRKILSRNLERVSTGNSAPSFIFNNVCDPKMWDSYWRKWDMDRMESRPSSLPNIEAVKMFMLAHPMSAGTESERLYKNVVSTLQEEYEATTSTSYDPAALEEAITLGDNDAVIRLQQAERSSLSFAYEKAIQIQKACDLGDQPLVQLLIENGADPETCVRGQTAMLRATVKGHEHVVQYLIEQGADINAAENLVRDCTPLQSACQGGCIGVVNTLLIAGALVDRDASLQMAAHSGFLQIVERLLAANANVNHVYKYMNCGVDFARTGTALRAAALAGHGDIILLLLQANADVNHVEDKPTALQLAVRGGFTSIVRLLIAAGAHVNFSGDMQRDSTPLDDAAQSGNLEITNLLLDAGAKALPMNEHWRSSIEIAAQEGHLGVVKRLFQAMENQGLFMKERQFYTAVFRAADGNHIETVRFLLKVNPWPDLLTRGYWNILDAAIQAANIDLTELLVISGADVDFAADACNAFTPLQRAVKNRSTRIVALLIASGANVNHSPRVIAPPLHLAALNGDLQMVKTLVEAGADTRSISYECTTVFEAAVESGSQETLRYLQNFQHRCDMEPRDLQFNSHTDVYQTACAMCQSLSMELLHHGESTWHPSLFSLQKSAYSGCQSCLLLWNELGIKEMSFPHSAPVRVRSMQEGIASVEICEPYPQDISLPQRLNSSFYIIEEPFAGRRRPMIGDTSSPNTFNLLHFWLDRCIRDHPRCRPVADQPFLPTRLIDLLLYEQVGLIRLVDSDNVDRKTECYATLSHCWGGQLAASAMTTQSNKKANYQAISSHVLPLTFVQAMEVTRAMGLRYLWIDSLCIIQDSRQDWERESAKMCDIYFHGAFCIAAAASSNSSQGLFRKTRPGDLQSAELSCKTQAGEVKRVMLVPHQKTWTQSYRPDPLPKRGWVLQERELSRRILHFTSSQVLWECRTCRATEGMENALVNHGEVPLRLLDCIHDLDKHSIHDLWFQIVTDYKSRLLTQGTDMFPAIGGLARSVSRFTKTKYLAGFWMGDLLRSLGWATSADLVGQSHMNYTSHARYPHYIAPTWSFASIIGPTAFVSVTAKSEEVSNFSRRVRSFEKSSGCHSISAQVVKAEAVLATPDPFGQLSSAYLQISAPILNAIIFKIGDGTSGTSIGIFSYLNNSRGEKIGDIYHDMQSNDGKFAVVGCIYLYPQYCCSHRLQPVQNTPASSSESEDTVAADPALAYLCGVGMAIIPVDGKPGTFQRVGHIQCLTVNAFIGLPVTKFTLI